MMGNLKKQFCSPHKIGAILRNTFHLELFDFEPHMPHSLETLATYLYEMSQKHAK